MKLRKSTIIEIDIEKCRQRVIRVGKLKDGYSKEQVERLLKLYDLFEQGKFEEARKFTDTWGWCPREGCNELEFIDSSIWKLLWNIHLGSETYDVVKL